MPLEPGSRLGPYEIVAPLGAGGMGEVYRARDPRLGRDVAIKVIAASGDGDDDRRRRFEQEARAVAALSHPNVLAIFDVGVGGRPYLVTELLDGETIRGLLARGPVPPERAVAIALQIAAGLAAAHDRGIVHRDLKPDNVFLTADGRVKILDFGLARQQHADALTMTQARTASGMMVGTLGYMSPEQVRGMEADPRSDIFAAGAVLYEMLSGRRAFQGASPADTISAILSGATEALVFPPATPRSLVQVVQRCLAAGVHERFQSARELAAALEAASDVRVAEAAPVSRALTSIAVLPFANMSADAENQYFSDGLAEELIGALARLAGLRVASRTSSFRFRGGDLDVREIGRELGVGAILEGSVRRSGDRLRVTAQLTGAADGYHIWSGRYDRRMADVFDIQDEIVEALVSAIAPSLSADVPAAVRRSTADPDAYERYLKGRHFLNQRSPAVMASAIRFFEESIARDPGFALAHAGLADAYSILRVYGWTPAASSQPRALEAVTRALALDPSLAEAHLSRALYVFHFEPRWRAARPHFEAALTASPGNALAEAYYALFLATEYEYAEARQRIANALAIDPQSPMIRFLTAAAACVVGDFTDALRDATRALELQPESMGARWPQTVSLAALGRFDEAAQVGDRVLARSRAPIYVGVLGMVHARAGRLADARRLADELDERRNRGEFITPAAVLPVWLGLRDRPRILEALDACAAGGAAPFSVLASSRFLLDEHRGDPAFDPLLDRLHDGARPDAHR